MVSTKSIGQPSILKTVDEFMAAVPWDEWRTVLVCRRQHGGRTYIRLRSWNKHRRFGRWYPSDRFFIIPIGNAGLLADAIQAAADGRAGKKPAWLKAREKSGVDELDWAGLIAPPGASDELR